MQIVITIIQIMLSVSLISLILLQSSKGGFASQGGGEFYRTKRGAEKFVFTTTIIIAILFLVTSVLSVMIR